ncbi:MAG: DUF2325 domain-containing protein [Betaproteobacteria bacterium]
MGADRLSILYVRERAHQIAQIKTVVERAGGTFVHHDGGMEERGELLPGLVGRADIAACPIDCVSHAAALVVKRLCRQADKPFFPPRSSGIASLLRALTSAEVRASTSHATVALGTQKVVRTRPQSEHRTADRAYS